MHMRRSKFSVVGALGPIFAAVAPLLFACAESSGWVPPVSSDRAGETAYEHRIYAGSCIFPPPEQQAGLLGIVGGLFLKEFAGTAVKSLGELIEEAGKEQVWKISDSRAVAFTPSSGPECVQIVRGRFYANPAKAPLTVADATWVLPLLNNDQLRAMARAGIWLAERPDLLLEFQVVRGPGQVAFQLGYISYNRAFRPITAGYDAEAALVIEFSLRPAGVAKGSDGAPVAQLVLGSVAPPFNFIYLPPSSWSPAATSESSDPISGPLVPSGAPPVPSGAPPVPSGPPAVAPSAQPDPDTGPNLSTAGVGFFKPEYSLPKQTTLIPLGPAPGETDTWVRALDVTLVETDPGNRFLKNLGAAIKGTESSVKTAVGERVVSSERAQALSAARDALKQATTTFYEAYATAERDVVTCKQAKLENATNQRELCVKARGSQRVANILAAPAGVPAPYSDTDMVQP